MHLCCVLRVDFFFLFLVKYIFLYTDNQKDFGITQDDMSQMHILKDNHVKSIAVHVALSSLNLACLVELQIQLSAAGGG